MNKKELSLVLKLDNEESYLYAILLMGGRNYGSGLIMGGANDKPRPFNEPHPLTAITMSTPTSSSSSLFYSPLTIGIIQCIIL